MCGSFLSCMGLVMKSLSCPIVRAGLEVWVGGKDIILTKIFHLSSILSGQFAQIHPERFFRGTRAFSHGLWWRSASPAEASG